MPDEDFEKNYKSLYTFAYAYVYIPLSILPWELWILSPGKFEWTFGIKVW